MKKEKLSKEIGILKLIGSPTRFAILKEITASKGTRCVHEIASSIGLSHSATSHQLGRLEKAGILSGTKTGQTVCYTVSNNEEAGRIRSIMKLFRNKGT